MAKPKAFSGNFPALRKCGATTCTLQGQKTACPPQDQMTNCDSQHHIDRLPDDVLVAILNFLTLKEAAVTSVVARRWEHLWKSHTSLNFDASKALDMIAEDHSLLETEGAKYIDWVNQVLSVHEGLQVEEFRICFDLTKVKRLDIDGWLKFAFAKGVQRLELDVAYCAKRILEKVYALPLDSSLAQCTGTSLAQPYPDWGGILSSNFVDFKPLKNLSLKFINVTDEDFQLFLMNCPFLEHLLVHHSLELVNVEVASRSLMLRSLEICDCKSLKSVKIFNANLASFILVASCDTVVLLQDLPFLVEVDMGVFTLLSNAFSKLPCCLSNLQTLAFSFFYPDDADMIVMEEENLEFPELPSVKHLILNITVDLDYSLLVFASMVNAFPCLQKLTIQLNWLGVGRHRKEMESIPPCPHKCLKVVEIGGYYGRISDLELAMYFIKNAVALEELIINPCRDWRVPKSIFGKAQEATARSFAKQQFENITVAPQTKLMIL